MTFWERAVRSVKVCSLELCLFVILVVNHLGFVGGTVVLIAPLPGHC